MLNNSSLTAVIPCDKDERLAALHSWLQKCLGRQFLHLQQLCGDASSRRYFRVNHDNRSLIVMDAPPTREKPQAFIAIARCFDLAGIHVPQIYNFDIDNGFILLEDFGDQTYLSLLDQTNVKRLYADALNVLFKIQLIEPKSSNPFQHYDETLLRNELEIFKFWVLETWLEIVLPDEIWTNLCQTLIANALDQPQVVVHRDFHSRNLMWVDDCNPGVLDFQDAVIGPATYDLVSLLRDCYISWPEEQVNSWFNTFLQNASNLFPKAPPDLWKQWFDLMGIQRHLKATGIFIRLLLRDGKSNYLQDLPRTLKYIEYISTQYSCLADLADFYQTQLYPRILQKLELVVSCRQ